MAAAKTGRAGRKVGGEGRERKGGTGSPIQRSVSAFNEEKPQEGLA